MTCIVGVSTAKGAILAADTQGTTPGTFQRADRDDGKVFLLAPWLGVGSAGSYRHLQVVRYHVDARDWTLPAPADRHRFAVTALVPALRTALRDNGALKVDSGVEEGGTFLVAIGRSLFVIYSDWQVATPRTPFAAIGAGDDIALGYLTRGKRLRRSDACRAILAAHTHNGSVNGHVTVVETEDAS